MESTSGASRTLSPNGHRAPAEQATAEAAAAEADHIEGSSSAGDSTGTAGSTGAARRPPGPSTRPALVVLGIAVLITVVGTVASGLVGQPAPSSSRPRVSTAKGSPLRAETSTAGLSSITSEGLPPSDVIGALDVPRGSAASPGSATNNGVGLYDRSLSFSVSASEEKVIEFFRAQLPFQLWDVLSKGPNGSDGAYRIVAQHPSSDGYEWELGVTIEPETFPASSRGSSSTDGSTPFTLRLFEVSDDT